MAKIFVEVIARHDREGNVKPLAIIWEDGRKFEVDRVLDTRKADSAMRYICRIAGNEVFLFRDLLENENKWFIKK